MTMRKVLLRTKFIQVFIWCVLQSLNSLAAEQLIAFQPTANSWPMKVLAISYQTNEHSCVKLAAQNLQTDLEKVTGQKIENNGTPTILIGTVGTNKKIDTWVKQGLLRNLKGKTEKYIIKSIDNQLVIAGSDKRGTVYGIYELSRQIGVSPWYYWADVPIVKHPQLYVKEGEYTDGEPAVRYRGLFLNDEAPCLTTWVKNTFGTD